MLFFELFPLFVAIVTLVVGVMLFAANRRAHRDPHAVETPRTPSRPDVSAADAAESATTVRRPSMRA